MMKRWLRRLVYAAIIIIWILLVSAPVLAFALAGSGQLQIGGDERHLRLFLLQEDVAQGVGIEWARPFAAPDAAADVQCIKTSVNYLLWEGEAEGVTFCQCFQAATGETMASGSEVCP